MTPDPTNPVLAVARVTRFLDALSARRGIDHEDIHAFDVGTDREAFLKASDLRLILAHLSQGWKPDREAVARIIDAEAFDIDLEVFATARWGSATEGRVAVAQIMLAERQKAALVKADAILALPTPAPKDEGWRPIDLIAEEDQRREAEDNGQFGVGS